MMSMCNKCLKMSGLVLLLVGLAYLLVDLGVWGFWGVSWWTAVFLLMGLGKLCWASCKMCQECAMPKGKSSKRKKR